jgi:hypothetical protein
MFNVFIASICLGFTPTDHRVLVMTIQYSIWPNTNGSSEKIIMLVSFVDFRSRWAPTREGEWERDADRERELETEMLFARQHFPYSSMTWTRTNIGVEHVTDFSALSLPIAAKMSQGWKFGNVMTQDNLLDHFVADCDAQLDENQFMAKVKVEDVFDHEVYLRITGLTYMDSQIYIPKIRATITDTTRRIHPYIKNV